MKRIILIIILAFIISANFAQRKEHNKHIQIVKKARIGNHDNISVKKELDSISSSSTLNNIMLSNQWREPEFYSAFTVDARVTFSNGISKPYLLVVKDTSKMAIKYQDSIFVIHISPKFVRKINDSTYTFKNQ